MIIPHSDHTPQPASCPQAPSGTTFICPHCGHSHGRYDQQASTVLDCLTLATEALSEAKRLVEAEVLP
jgi:hypothetical protein